MGLTDSKTVQITVNKVKSSLRFSPISPTASHKRGKALAIPVSASDPGWRHPVTHYECLARQHHLHPVDPGTIAMNPDYRKAIV